jgi:eukaryotic translation initiation factor 2C
VCSSIFVQPLLLIDFVQKILKIDVDRNLTEHEYDKVSMLSPALIQNAMCIQMSDGMMLFSEFHLLKALWDVKIEVTHRGNKHHKYRIAGLSVKPTNDLR